MVVFSSIKLAHTDNFQNFKIKTTNCTITMSKISNIFGLLVNVFFEMDKSFLLAKSKNKQCKFRAAPVHTRLKRVQVRQCNLNEMFFPPLLSPILTQYFLLEIFRSSS